jgi:RimJ/RimL family protein N-acetyltransferase
MPANAALAREIAGIEVREMRPDDDAALLRFHAGLSAETVYLRFFGVHPELSDSELARFTNVDHRDREAIVALVGSEIVGVARFDRCSERDAAEVAFVVADGWQGRGVGTRLFHDLAARARRLGVRRFVAETLPHNRRMLAVFSHAGLPVSTTFANGVVNVSLVL